MRTYAKGIIVAIMLFASSCSKEVDRHLTFSPTLALNDSVFVNRSYDLTLSLNNIINLETDNKYIIRYKSISGEHKLIKGNFLLLENQDLIYYSDRDNDEILIRLVALTYGSSKLNIEVATQDTIKTVSINRKILADVGFDIIPTGAGSYVIDTLNSIVSVKENPGYIFEGIYIRNSFLSREKSFRFTWSETNTYQLFFKKKDEQ